MNDGDWICNEQNCGNINFARRTSCYRCNAEKPEAENSSKKKLGTEIGKSAAEKSRGLFNADDWQCNKCANVNWARRTTCNVCNAPKFGEVEARTGYGGGYNERGVVEYRRREGSSDDEYDEFGRKKRKPARSETDDKVGITEGAEYKNLLPKPQMEMKVRNCMLVPATEKKVITEHLKPKGRLSDGSVGGDSTHLISSAKDNKPHYQSYNQNIKNMHSKTANSFYQSRQNRKRNVSIIDVDAAGSSGCEAGPKKTRKDSTDSPVFISFDPVMENMVTSTNEVVYKFNGVPSSQNFEVVYTVRERAIAAAFAIAYNNCKVSSARFESLIDKPAPDFKTLFAWRQQLLGTGCLNDSHSLVKTACTQVKPARVPNPDEIEILSDCEDTSNNKMSKKVAPQTQQRSDSVETVVLERVEKDTKEAKFPFKSDHDRGTRSTTHSGLTQKGTYNSSSESRNSDSSDTDSEQMDIKSSKSKTSTRSSRPAITSARQSVMGSDSESLSYHSDEDNFLSRKFGEAKKVRRKFKRRNVPVPSPATCNTSEKPDNYVPNVTQSDTNINTQPFQGYCTAKSMEKSPLITGNIYTPNLRNMTAKTHQNPIVDAESISSEYVPTRLGATAKNNYQDFKNNVRLNRPGYWAKANGATLSTKCNNISQGAAPGLSQQNRSSKGSAISYISSATQPDKYEIEKPKSSMIPGSSVPDNYGEYSKRLCNPVSGVPDVSPVKKHVTYIPGFGEVGSSPIKRAISTFVSGFDELQKPPRIRAISSFIPIENPKGSVQTGLGAELPAKQSYSAFQGFSKPDQTMQKQKKTIPGTDKTSPSKHINSSISRFEEDKPPPLPNYASSPDKGKTVQKNSFDFMQDNLAGEHKVPFDVPRNAIKRGDQKYEQMKSDKYFPPVDQIPLPEKPPENTERIFAVLQENSGSKNRSIMDIFDNSLTNKSPERKNELEKYENVRKSYENKWDEHDDALYGESSNKTLKDKNASPITSQIQSPTDIMLYENSDSMERSPTINQADLLYEKKETLMGILHDFQNNANEQTPQKYKSRAHQPTPNEKFYSHTQSSTTQFEKPVRNLNNMPGPIPQELSEELLRMSEDGKSNKAQDKCSPHRTVRNESPPIIIRDAKRIHVIESITIEPASNQNHCTHQTKSNTELDLMPVEEIPKTHSKLDESSYADKIEILDDSSEDQASTRSPPQPQPTPQVDLSNFLAGINANTLMLALQNLNQLAHHSVNSSFSSTQNISESELNTETVQAVDTNILTNDDWEKESVRDGSIERQLEAMDGNPGMTPLLSDIFDPCPSLKNVTRKLNINIESAVDNSDSQKPDENAPVIGNFKSFALPKPPRLNRVKVPIKTSAKSSKRKGDGKRKRKKKKPAGSQDEGEAEEEEESGDEADLAKYDLWGSEDEGSKTGSSSKTGGSSKAGSKSKEEDSSKSEDLEDKNGKTDSPASKTSSKTSKKSRSRSSSSSSSSSTSSSSESQSSSQSASGSPKNKFDDFNLNSEREMSPRPRTSRSPRPRISAPLPRRKSHDSRGSNGESRSHETTRDKEWTRDRERRPERARGARSGDRKERRYSREGSHYSGRGRHR